MFKTANPEQHVTSESLLDRIGNRVTSCLGRHIPDRTKRLIFISSVYARLRNVDRLDSDLLEKLNALMALSTRDNALKLPVELSRVIWYGKNADELCMDDVFDNQITETRMQAAAYRLIQKMPRWLHYSSDRVMVSDLVTLFSHRQQIVA